ncbi:MAG: hypothetical protein A2Z31_01045 [candidate division NC10 bacterium RBG_16_65_8]|nr:MAG: hypothetical protein A2Z31_01045 [candidate division NC10 bacterium RBG_16_65_8]
MSPTVFRHGVYRFFFFSREEPRIHVHVYAPHAEAKFWIEPEITLAQNHGLTLRQLRILRRVILEREDEIRRAWRAHFKG